VEPREEPRSRSSAITGLKPVTIVQADPPSALVAQAILEYILSGHVGPGEKLPSERQLSEALGVGRSIAREGLKSLGLLGLVEFRHGGGSYLRSMESTLLPRVIEWGLLLGERRVVDLVEARRFLEIDMARLAAERHTPEQFAEIEAALGRMKSARTAEEFTDADVDFHLAVGAACGNSALANMHASIASLLRVWIHRVMDAAESLEPSYLEHVPILEALRARDPEAAAAAIADHLERAGGRLVSTLEDPDAVSHVRRATGVEGD
jgi:GntR family transcriptional repressor for pyruvate dehydrogenase complex